MNDRKPDPWIIRHLIPVVLIGWCVGTFGGTAVSMWLGL